jgi:hypothetical protein
VVAVEVEPVQEQVVVELVVTERQVLVHLLYKVLHYF